MYELKVKDKGGVWHNLDLTPNEEPAMTYQVNDIAELKDRQADYSQKIRLPKTALNAEVLERVDIFEASPPTPYVLLECRLFSNGFTLAGKGSLFVIDQVGEYIEGQIISGNADLFYTMQNRLIEDADLGYTIVGSGALPQWVRRGGAVLGKQFEAYKSFSHYFFNLHETAKRLVELCGYTLDTNLPLTTIQRDFFSAPSLLPSNDSLEVFTSNASFRRTGEAGIDFISDFTSRHFPHAINNNGLGTLTQVGNTEVGAIPYRLKFTSNINGKIKVRVYVSGSKYYDPGGLFSLQCVIYKGGSEAFNILKPPTETVYNIDENVEIDVEVGEEIFLITRLVKNTTLGASCRVDMSGSFTITEIEADEVPIGGKLYFGNNTGFTTYLDLFKEFCQSYGLTIQVDNNNKIIKAYTMDKLYENKTIAKDWSDKLSRENQEMSFIIDGYGQNNFIRFEKKDDLEDKGNFYVDNDNLGKEKDLFTIKWESGIDVKPGTYDLAYIPLYEYDEEIADKKKFVKGKPHLVRFSQVDYNPYSIMNHIPAQSLVDNYYDKLVNKMLVRAKCLSVEMLLTERDIEELDFFTPIYLKQFGAYFYVSKINNFVAYDRLTKVDLIRL
jgi:hypothetical protein